MNTDPIKAKIQELVPEIPGTTYYGNGRDEPRITLSVVLRAIRKNDTEALAVRAAGDLVFESRNSWNLETDDWESQTRETQLFIGSLLQV